MGMPIWVVVTWVDPIEVRFLSKRGFGMYEDKTLQCKECGEDFVFTAGEQEFYAERSFQNEPQRCKPCRDARKLAARGPRVYHTAVCADCGGEAKVPFEPKSDRPVYCSDCFARIKDTTEAE
jgi:CxxC-x17-CxxC domain-containing protein